MRRIHLTLLAVLPLTGCGLVADGEPPSRDTQSELNTLGTPVRDGSPFATLPAAALPSTTCKECSVSSGAQIGAPSPTLGDSLGGYSLEIDDWKLGSGLRPTYTSTATDAASFLTGYSTDPKSSFNSTAANLASAKVLFDDLCSTIPTGCTATISGVARTSWSRAFPHVDGRQLAFDYAKDSHGFDVPHAYLPAPDMNELRMRGARTYCATREAAVAQQAAGAYGMTDTSLLDFLLWRIGVAQSGVRILSPVKNAADPESEVFALPIALSGRIAPVEGPLMPDFGEMSHTMVWMTGDREILSRESYGPVRTGICFGGAFERCIPLPVFNGSRRAYRNIEHIDVLAGTGATGRLDISDVPIIEYGFFSLKAGANFVINSGFVDDASSFAGGRVAFPGGGAPWLSPRAGDTADAPTRASDAPLVMNGPFFLPVEGGSSPLASWQTPAGIAPRARFASDDDRAVVVGDRVDTTVTLTAKAGFSLGPVTASIDAHSSVDAWVQQDIAVREQLGVADGASLLPATAAGHVAQANLVFTPSSRFGVTIDPLTLTLKLALHLHIDLAFTSVDIDLEWSDDIFSVKPIPIAADPKVANEAQRLRIGTFSEQDLGPSADPSRQHPSVSSHLPAPGAGFASFPAGTDVRSCLALPTTPMPPPPAKPTKPKGPETRALCIEGLAPLELNGVPPGFPGVPAATCTSQAVRDTYAAAFADASDFKASDPAQRTKQRAAEIDCATRALDLLCRPTSKRLSTSAGDVLSHVLTPAESADYGDVKSRCIAAFAMAGSDGDSAKFIGETAAKKLLNLVSCSPDGTPTPTP